VQSCSSWRLGTSPTRDIGSPHEAGTCRRTSAKRAMPRRMGRRKPRPRHRVRNAPFTIGMAKCFPAARVTGSDYWSRKWEYSQSVCEGNATIEGVAERVNFQKARASALPFEAGSFDVAVSNLVFHEVSDTNDKREVIKEALRVVRKGGMFAFQDLFQKRAYATSRSCSKQSGLGYRTRRVS